MSKVAQKKRKDTSEATEAPPAPKYWWQDPRCYLEVRPVFDDMKLFAFAVVVLTKHRLTTDPICLGVIATTLPGIEQQKAFVAATAAADEPERRAPPRQFVSTGWSHPESDIVEALHNLPPMVSLDELDAIAAMVPEGDRDNWWQHVSGHVETIEGAIDATLEPRHPLRILFHETIGYGNDLMSLLACSSAWTNSRPDVRRTVLRGWREPRLLLDRGGFEHMWKMTAGESLYDRLVVDCHRDDIDADFEYVRGGDMRTKLTLIPGGSKAEALDELRRMTDWLDKNWEAAISKI